jgi:hypothetical protein
VLGQVVLAGEIIDRLNAKAAAVEGLVPNLLRVAALIFVLWRLVQTRSALRTVVAGIAAAAVLTVAGAMPVLSQWWRSEIVSMPAPGSAPATHVVSVGV